MVVTKGPREFKGPGVRGRGRWSPAPQARPTHCEHRVRGDRDGTTRGLQWEVRPLNRKELWGGDGEAKPAGLTVSASR